MIKYNLSSISKQDKKWLIKNAMSLVDFSKRDRHILEDWCFGETIESLAKIYELSSVRIRQILTKIYKEAMNYRFTSRQDLIDRVNLLKINNLNVDIIIEKELKRLMTYDYKFNREYIINNLREVTI